MEIDAAREGGSVVLRLGGRLDREWAEHLSRTLEDLLRDGTERNETGTTLAIPPGIVSRITERVAREVDRLMLAGHPAVILCAPAVRTQVRQLADLIQPDIEVLSYNEILKEIRVESLGTVTAE